MPLKDLENISLSVKAGEILGIAGISGNGQAELMASPDFRRDPAAVRCIATQVHLDGRFRSAISAPPQRRKISDFAFVPEDRLGRGAVQPYVAEPQQPFSPPIHLGLKNWHGLIRYMAEARRLHPANASPDHDVRTSGGSEAEASGRFPVATYRSSSSAGK